MRKPKTITQYWLGGMYETPPSTNMGCLLGIMGKILISSLKGSHAVKEEPAPLKFQELFAKNIVAQGQQTQVMQMTCPLSSARASPREAPGCSSSKASQKQLSRQATLTQVRWCPALPCCKAPALGRDHVWRKPRGEKAV